MSKPLRIDRILASCGYGSRSTVRGLLRADLVSAEGTVIRSADHKLLPEAVRLDGAPLDHPTGLLVMVNKPAGYACSRNPGESPLLYDLLPERWLRRNPVPVSIGRLDRDTTGLILVTDDMALVHRLTAPAHGVEKTYQVEVDGPIDPSLVTLFASGSYQLKGEEKPCRPARLLILEERRAELTIHEGRFHQVRRMFAEQELTVTALHRSRFGPYSLGGLAPGDWVDVPRSEGTA